jgi:transcriptional coactivator HFI1/ADA1
VWVSSATDKSANGLTSKPSVASDAAEQRLKVEVMALLPRDRRRIKAIAADKAEDDAAARRNIYEEYYRASKIRVPDSVPASAGGLNKTNWDLEIRKRYAQPLFSETLEFPDAAAIYARMVPICYEESVAAGANQTCAELVAIATESHVKDFLAQIFDRTRSNGPKYDNGAGGGVFTGAYKRQLEREEEDFKNGKVQKGRENGLLPVEAREAMTRRPIGMADMKVAANIGRGLWNGMPLIESTIVEAALEDELDEWRKDRAAEQDWISAAKMYALANGVDDTADDPMDMDDEEIGWEGVARADRETLGSLLEDCLAVRA